MLWIAPYVSADSPEFRIGKEGYLLKKKDGAACHYPLVAGMGFSACYDTTNPEVMEYLKQQPCQSEKYGIDGLNSMVRISVI